MGTMPWVNGYGWTTVIQVRRDGKVSQKKSVGLRFGFSHNTQSQNIEVYWVSDNPNCSSSIRSGAPCRLRNAKHTMPIPWSFNEVPSPQFSLNVDRKRPHTATSDIQRSIPRNQDWFREVFSPQFSINTQDPCHAYRMKCFPYNSASLLTTRG